MISCPGTLQTQLETYRKNLKDKIHNITLNRIVSYSFLVNACDISAVYHIAPFEGLTATAPVVIQQPVIDFVATGKAHGTKQT